MKTRAQCMNHSAAGRPVCIPPAHWRLPVVAGDTLRPSVQQDLKKGAAPIDLHRPLTLEERQRIVTEAMGTDLEDAEDLLRRQRARLDA